MNLFDMWWFISWNGAVLIMAPFYCTLVSITLWADYPRIVQPAYHLPGTGQVGPRCWLDLVEVRGPIFPPTGIPAPVWQNHLTRLWCEGRDVTGSCRWQVLSDLYIVLTGRQAGIKGTSSMSILENYGAWGEDRSFGEVLCRILCPLVLLAP